MIVRVPARYRSRRHRWVALAVVVGLLAVAGTGAFLLRQYFGQIRADIKDLMAEGETGAGTSPSPSTVSTPVRRDPDATANDPFPRRLLAIYVHDYLYANPVTCGDPDGEENFHTLTQKLAQVLHVADTQVLELSDVFIRKAPLPQPAKRAKAGKGKGKKTEETAAGPEIIPGHPPLKPILEQTIKEFLNTCRAQDRVIVLFVGHVVELDGEGFLAPIEGDLSAKDTLLSLSKVYEQLVACKARQKVLILDTCRLDPTQGLERPGSGPLGTKLDSQLAKPPIGVQVWCPCQATQYSYESGGRSVFLEALGKSLTHKVIQKMQEQQDPFPVDALAKEVERLTTASVAEHWNAKQTPRLTGIERVGGADYDKTEALPNKLEIPATPKPAAEMAAREEIRGIFQEVDVPPMRMISTDTPLLPIDALLSFSSRTMEPYQKDYRSLKEIKSDANKYPLRIAVLEALDAIRNGFNPKNDAFSLQDSFPAGNSEARKKEIYDRQMKPAKVMALLTEAIDNMHTAGADRDAEKSKRWQAHYDYVLAMLLGRAVYVTEYDLMLGKIRKDELPELKPNVDTGWRLASRDKLSSSKEAKEMATERKKLLAKIIKQYAGTPWAVLARREELTALGLEWQTTR